ncbi:MAG: xanthine dehydrogenase family protein molybdopterin-binding subunit [Alphaproteobacteria bacterium]|nr:xanthine dehydrogenase family protein molybdopterin-binding subunit [Alphaproteobacteria bacterium]
MGRPLRRLEDRRLLTGRGCFTDDFRDPEAAYAVVVRAPHAHAEIRSVETAAARRAAGVLAVLTAADYAADGHHAIAHNPIPADAHDVTKPAFQPEHGVIREIAMPPLAHGRVRFVGEPVALVVAATLNQARDAAELVRVDYAPLPAVTGEGEAMRADAPTLWRDAPGNIALDLNYGDEAATGRAFAAAARVVERVFTNQRIANCQMEPRAALGRFDAASGRYTLIAGTQGVVRQRATLAAALGVAPERVRVISRDVGGGFGPRGFLEAEAVLTCWAARRSGRPVRWIAERSEDFLSGYQGRDLTTRAALAFDQDGRIRAMRVHLVGNLGAYTVNFAPLANGFRLVSTVYDVPIASVRVTGVLTNTPATVAFRGAGRPEAVFAIERLLDLAAPRLGIDRVELRRRNLVKRGAMPYRTAMGMTYDCGDFAANMTSALVRADWAGFAARRIESRKRGKRRGIGLANYVETPVGAPRERVEITVRGDGVVEAVAGTQSTGQGHETTFAQIIADQLGVPVGAIQLVTGDTDRVAVGGGTHSNRSMRLAGTLLVRVAADVVAAAHARAAHRLGIARDTVWFRDGLFGGPGTNRVFSLFDLARAWPDDPPGTGALSAAADFTGRIPAFPTGCAICELEVDPETGLATVARYTSVDDVGQPINPLVVAGQTHGGIAQGIGQALCEAVRWDAAGQMLSGSFMDYALPRGGQLPFFDVTLAEDPTAGNPLRVKGGGEGGITPAPAAVCNALADALAEDGVEEIEMPATPERVWRALAATRARQTKR